MKEKITRRQKNISRLMREKRSHCKDMVELRRRRKKTVKSGR